MPLTPGRFAGQVLNRRATTSQRGFAGFTAAEIGQGEAFSPIDLSPVLWLDAADTATITSSSGAVSAWADKSGNGYSAAQATSTKQPTTGSSTLNGRNVLSFDGGDCLQIASFDCTGGTAQQFTVAAVFTATSGSDRILIEHSADYNTTPGAFIVYRANANNVVTSKRGSGGASYASFETTATITTTAKSLVATHDGTLSTNETTAWILGDTAGTRTNNSDTNQNSASATLNVGSRNNAASAQLNGTIAELVVVTRAISTTERVALEAYLKRKWAL